MSGNGHFCVALVIYALTPAVFVGVRKSSLRWLEEDNSNRSCGLIKLFASNSHKTRVSSIDSLEAEVAEQEQIFILWNIQLICIFEFDSLYGCGAPFLIERIKTSYSWRPGSRCPNHAVPLWILMHRDIKIHVWKSSECCRRTGQSLPIFS